MTNLKQLWPGWDTVRVIGSGGFGRVYEIKKTDSAGEFHSALKVISVPQSPDEYREYQDDGYDDQSITAIFKSRVDDIVSEFQLMSQFRGTANIVSYEDHRIVEHENGMGWDVMIRMELLTPLPDMLRGKVINDDEVCRIGINICNALELCAQRNIIHRDIKPQNIFVNGFGDYKLGDFGIAKTMDHTTRATKIGTYSYMAPEVYKNQPYNETADIYSLGLVLYWLLNERRLPFIPLPPQVPTAAQNSEAQARRLNGEAIPKPKNGPAGLHDVILIALEYDPKKRFANASAMKRALTAVLENDKQETPGNAGIIEKGPIEESITKKSVFAREDEETVHTAYTDNQQYKKVNGPSEIKSTEIPTEKTEKTVIGSAARSDQVAPYYGNDPSGNTQKRKGKTGLIIGIVVAAVIIIIVLMLLMRGCGGSSSSVSYGGGSLDSYADSSSASYAGDYSASYGSSDSASPVDSSSVLFEGGALAAYGDGATGTYGDSYTFPEEDGSSDAEDNDLTAGTGGEAYAWMGMSEMAKCNYMDIISANHYIGTYDTYYENGSVSETIEACDGINTYLKENNYRQYNLEGIWTDIDDNEKKYWQYDFGYWQTSAEDQKDAMENGNNITGREFKAVGNEAIPIYSNEGDTAEYEYYEFNYPKLEENGGSQTERYYMKDGDVFAIWTLIKGDEEEETAENTKVIKSISADIPEGTFDLPDLSDYEKIEGAEGDPYVTLN